LSSSLQGFVSKSETRSGKLSAGLDVLVKGHEVVECTWLSIELIAVSRHFADQAPYIVEEPLNEIVINHTGSWSLSTNTCWALYTDA